MREIAIPNPGSEDSLRVRNMPDAQSARNENAIDLRKQVKTFLTGQVLQQVEEADDVNGAARRFPESRQSVSQLDTVDSAVFRHLHLLR